MLRLSLGLAAACVSPAQPQAEELRFEVISIKPADPAAQSRSVQTTPGGYRAKNIRLFELIMSAWHLNRDQIIGGPSWLETAGWDIDARFPEGQGPAHSRDMLRNMLADRFQLKIHRETRDLSIYVLSVAKGGVRLKQGDGAHAMSAGSRMIRYSSATMGELAGQLSSYLERQVVDQTGLTGEYAIHLSFAPVDSGGDSSGEPAPSLFQALQDQAGLKLGSSKGPVEVFVIDRAGKPSAN